MGFWEDLYGTPPPVNGREICPWCKWPLEDFGDGRFECTNKKHVGGVYFSKNGKLISVDELHQQQDIKCIYCGISMRNGVSSLPYENGNNAYASIRCPHCGSENIFDGFGFDDE